MSVNFLNETYYLSVLKNCDQNQRFIQWQNDGGTLLGNKNLGCGINSLTFLGVLTRKQGELLVKIVNSRGTSFSDMMNLVYNFNGGNQQYLFSFDISTQNLVDNFIRTLTNLLCENCCTIAKLMRYPDNTPLQNAPLCNKQILTSGHSIVFSKIKGEIYAIDPQQLTLRKSIDIAKAFKAWNNNCYVQIYLMFNKKQTFVVPNYQPMDIDNLSGPPLSLLPDRGPITDYVSDEMEIDYDISQTDEDAMEIDGGRKKKTKKLKNKNKKNKNKTLKFKLTKK
jgi:hypothetical protein